MKIRFRSLATVAVVIGLAAVVRAAVVVPTEVQQPGTQPGQVANLESPDKCDNCHGGYNTTHEPAHNWRGSMMAQATRDPIFWATMAVAEQDFDGAGDLCLRCHTPEGWLGGRSTPTDGSALTAGDADGVSCDTCHKLTNPNNSEHLGLQVSPFLAYDEKTPATGYYGSGMYAMWGGSEKLGPYASTNARHQFLPSSFHRQSELCGTCHDVSNPVTGDLAHGNGAQIPLAPGTFSGTPGSPVDGKAAFNNFPFQYGVVERTFSEHKSSLLSSMRVADYATLPADLRAGAIKVAYDSAMVAGKGGNYEDGTTRYFTCQGCHLRPVTGQGCNKNPVVRKDLPLHDMTGGNYWIPDAILWLDARGLLRLGGGLTATQQAAITDGKTRALKQLSEATALSVSGNTLKVVNLTGHKLLSGYPEGRRMWINTKWYDGAGNLLREDGRYGPIQVVHNGSSMQVETLVNEEDPYTRVYEAHYGMTQEWAQQLVSIGKPAGLPLAYDRTSGAVATTLGQLAAQQPGTHFETFHFVLNNGIFKDNRIPPYGMSYDEAKRRNALPVPETQFGNPGPGGRYAYWDEFPLAPPAGAAWADIDLLYQPTSWEYIQFLALANTGQNAFLAAEGTNLLQAWLATGMAKPYAMASATWGTPPATQTLDLKVAELGTYTVTRSGTLGTQGASFAKGSTVGFKVVAADALNAPVSGGQVFLTVKGPSGAVVTTIQAFTDASGTAVAKWKTAKTQAAGTYTGVVTDVLKSGYQFVGGATSVTFQIN